MVSGCGIYRYIMAMHTGVNIAAQRKGPGVFLYHSLPDSLGLDTESLYNTLESPPSGKSPRGLLCLPSHREGCRRGWGFDVCSGIGTQLPLSLQRELVPTEPSLPATYSVVSSYVNNLRKIKVEDSCVFIIVQKAQNYFLPWKYLTFPNLRKY